MTDRRYGPPADTQKLLDEKLAYYQSLDQGTREPRTGEEKHFLLVCRGKAMAVTHDEHAYKQFREENITPAQNYKTSKKKYGPNAHLEDNLNTEKPIVSISNLSRGRKTFDPKAYLAANPTIKKPKRIRKESNGQSPKPKNKKIKETFDPTVLSSGSRYLRTEISSTEKKKLNREAYMAALERKKERDKNTGGIPEYEEGAPRTEFGTREEYQKMQGRDFSDIRRRKNE